MRCEISPDAIRDLDEISDYFLGRNVLAGEQLFREFNTKCSQLAKFPNSGHSYAHIIPQLRGLPLKGYIILYVVQDNLVEILRVVNGRRDLKSMFDSN